MRPELFEKLRSLQRVGRFWRRGTWRKVAWQSLGKDDGVHASLLETTLVEFTSKSQCSLDS